MARHMTPSKKGKWYANENKSGKHNSGPKKDKALTKAEKAYRAGYTNANKDHAQAFKYKDARAKGYSKDEARKIAEQRYNPNLPRKN